MAANLYHFCQRTYYHVRAMAGILDICATWFWAEGTLILYKLSPMPCNALHFYLQAASP